VTSTLLQASAERQPPLAAVAGDRHALHMLHDDVGVPVRRHAAVEQGDDVRVLQRSEDLALRAKAPRRLRAVEARRDQLDRDPLLEAALGPLRAVHGAHAAFADAFLELERADASRDPNGLGGLRFARRDRGERARCQEITRARVRGKQRLHLGPQLSALAAVSFERGRASAVAGLEHRAERLLDVAPEPGVLRSGRDACV
jgi:hypothetical protein